MPTFTCFSQNSVIKFSNVACVLNCGSLGQCRTKFKLQLQSMFENEWFMMHALESVRSCFPNFMFCVLTDFMGRDTQARHKFQIIGAIVFCFQKKKMRLFSVNESIGSTLHMRPCQTTQVRLKIT